MEIERPIEILQRRGLFGDREVGLTHPDLSSYVKLSDSGSIEIMVDDGVGIVIDKTSRSITFVADTVKFVTRENDGFKWNNKCLNPYGSEFQEPALLEMSDDEPVGFFDAVEKFFDEDN